MVNLELGTVDNGKSMSEILKDALDAKDILRGSLQKRWDGHRRIFLRD